MLDAESLRTGFPQDDLSRRAVPADRHLIGADHPGVPVLQGHRGGLGSRQAHGKREGRLAGTASLIHPGLAAGKIQAQAGQEIPAVGGGRG